MHATANLYWLIADVLSTNVSPFCRLDKYKLLR